MTGLGDDRADPLVLVADDDDDILELIAFRLGRDGYRIVTASNGEQALRIAREQLPDLAVLDVMMPLLTGIEVTERLRAEGVRLPIVLLTARVQEVEISRGSQVGADDYVQKPFSPKELRDRIEAALARRFGEI
jgi:DNA-binding response OmpR family regulator